MWDDLLWIGMAAAALGVGTLRWSWALKRRSTAGNMIGWSLLVAASIAGGIAAGAWGVAVVSLAAMGLAALLLAWAAATSPAGKAKSPDRQARMLPAGDGPLRLGRRIVTFALVIVAGLVASVSLAIALRSFTIGLGWSEADANATALFAVPIAWGGLATVMLMLETRRGQVLALLVTTLPLVPALIVGG